MTELAWATLSSPVGPLAVGCSPAGVARLDFRAPGGAGRRPAGRTASPQAAPSQAAPPQASRPQASRPQPGPGLLGAARDQLAEYFAGQRHVFDLPLDWSACSRAQHQVLSVLYDSVGYGETVTYGELAQRAVAGPDGISLPARAIGRIMGSNPLPLIVPCHRVVAGNGLGGYSGGTGIEIKRWLLIFEGALPATLDWSPAGA
ncbi:MAG TPA: methylated-DNA--[protein]-cysteine S-methyltransferase [Streptosporangiaceae bacterium]|jgi:methylated-DNA-[protein]-cysteine S-methyltransferase